MNVTVGRNVSVLLFLLALASSATAAEWSYIGSDGAANQYFYKPKTYALKDGFASSWIRTEHNVDMAAAVEKKIAPEEYKGRKTIITYEVYKCADRKKRVLAGRIIEDKEDRDVTKTLWTAIAAGSADEMLLEALCKAGGVKAEQGKGAVPQEKTGKE